MFTIYYRDNCHLCDMLHADLLAWMSRNRSFGDAQIRHINVDSQPELSALMGMKVPVLWHNDDEVCFGRFDPENLERLL